MVDLATPWALVLLPLPVLVIWFFPSRHTSGSVVSVPDSIGRSLVREGQGRGATVADRVHQWLPWLIWGLLVFAVAGPRQVLPVPALKVSGRDMAVVLDLSGSMVRDDFYLNGKQITRLDAVTTVGAEFARRRAGDRLALIVFGSQAYYAAPFSFDTEAVAQRIETATIGISGRATNISDGLGLALKRFEVSQARTRVAILLSDGVNNAGATNPRGVAELAAQMGVRVHTIALGPKDTSTAEDGERGVVDAATLRAIAQVSGGEYFRVRTTEDLARVMDSLDQLEAIDSDGLAAEVFREFWIWPASLALLLCLVLAWKEPV